MRNTEHNTKAKGIAMMNLARLVAAIMLFVISSTAIAQKAEVIKFDRLEDLITKKSGKIQVINFWATWCAPCVQELPYFQNLAAKQHPDVEITLINLDFADKVGKVNAFIAKRKITSPVLLLDEVDYNSWIDRIDPSWGGAIPATLFINTTTGQRKFVDKPITESELESYIKSVKSSN